MDELDWQSTTDCLRILNFIKSRFSERKLRLYLCGGARQLEHLSYNHGIFKAIEIVERYGDGLADADLLHEAAYVAEASTFGYDFQAEFYERHLELRSETLEILVKMGALSESVLTGGEWRVNEPIRDRLLTAAELIYQITNLHTSETLARIPPEMTELDMVGHLTHIAAQMSELDWPGFWLRNCVCGNPFRPVTLNPTWLSSTVISLVAGIYPERTYDPLPLRTNAPRDPECDFAAMPYLADALHDAGCDSADMLNHCRSGGPHVRGCWVVDLLLGKV